MVHPYVVGLDGMLIFGLQHCSIEDNTEIDQNKYLNPLLRVS
jgi:hypothetical protein